MRKAFLIHVESTQEAIKRKGYFKAYVDSNKVYMDQRSVIKQVKAQLAKLDDFTLQFPMSLRRTVFKRWSLPSRTTISRCRLAKVRSSKS